MDSISLGYLHLSVRNVPLKGLRLGSWQAARPCSPCAADQADPSEFRAMIPHASRSGSAGREGWREWDLPAARTLQAGKDGDKTKRNWDKGTGVLRGKSFSYVLRQECNDFVVIQNISKLLKSEQTWNRRSIHMRGERGRFLMSSLLYYVLTPIRIC